MTVLSTQSFIEERIEHIVQSHKDTLIQYMCDYIQNNSEAFINEEFDVDLDEDVVFDHIKLTYLSTLSEEERKWVNRDFPHFIACCNDIYINPHVFAEQKERLFNHAEELKIYKRRGFYYHGHTIHDFC